MIGWRELRRVSSESSGKLRDVRYRTTGPGVFDRLERTFRVSSVTEEQLVEFQRLPQIDDLFEQRTQDSDEYLRRRRAGSEAILESRRHERTLLTNSEGHGEFVTSTAASALGDRQGSLLDVTSIELEGSPVIRLPIRCAGMNQCQLGLPQCVGRAHSRRKL